MDESSRRWVAGFVRVGLVVLAFLIVFVWIKGRVHAHTSNLHLKAVVAPPPDQLGPGDLRIYNTDSSVDLVLQGDKILTGLSPKMVAKVRTQMDTEHVDSGLGGSIAQMVKRTVASAIGTHAVFALADVRDVRFDSGQMIFDWKDGTHRGLFDGANVQVDKKPAKNAFRPEDARRFIDAVHARKKELGQ